MKKNKDSIVVLALCALIGIVGLGWITGCSQKSEPKPVEPTAQPAAVVQETGVVTGKILPSFELETSAGQKVSVAATGKITIINFWTTWCPPCREEMPELDRFAAARKGKVDFYSINIQESANKVDEFMQQNKYSMTVLLDKEGAVAKMFRVTAIPTTMIVDGKGLIQYRKAGTVTQSELEAVIKDL